MKTISAADLSTLLARQPGLRLIDVRTPVEFAEVHVPQAANHPLDSFSPADFSPDVPTYILCRSGQRAAKAAEKITSSGNPDAIVVEGGTLAWIDAGLPVNRGVSKSISLERQVRIAAGSLVLTGFLLGSFLHPTFFLLSGFVGAGLIFAGITDWCGMGLLLAKAPWNK